MNTWDSAAKKLTPFKRMTMSQKIDANGNRELTHMKSDIEGVGYVDIATYVDFTSNKITQKSDDLGFCQTIDNPMPLNLHEFLQKVMDPNGGLTTYRGVVKMDWANHDLHAFDFTFDYPQVGEKTETLYFCTETLDVKFITVEGMDFIVQVPSIAEKTFTDADFQGVECDSAKHSQVMVPFTPKKGFFF